MTEIKKVVVNHFPISMRHRVFERDPTASVACMSALTCLSVCLLRVLGVRIPVSEDEADRLRRSLLDRVRPSGLFAGPVLLDSDTADRKVAVLQAFSHPLGLPASAKGRFWVRVGAETREMNYDEVRRRFLAAGDLTDSTRDRAATILRSVSAPMAARYLELMSARGHPEIRMLPFAIAFTPLGSPRDLGFSGGDLLSALNRAAELERTSYSGHIGEGFRLNEWIVIGGRGLDAS